MKYICWITLCHLFCQYFVWYFCHYSVFLFCVIVLCIHLVSSYFFINCWFNLCHQSVFLLFIITFVITLCHQFVSLLLVITLLRQLASSIFYHIGSSLCVINFCHYFLSPSSVIKFFITLFHQRTTLFHQCLSSL